MENKEEQIVIDENEKFEHILETEEEKTTEEETKSGKGIRNLIIGIGALAAAIGAVVIIKNAITGTAEIKNGIGDSPKTSVTTGEEELGNETSLTTPITTKEESNQTEDGLAQFNTIKNISKEELIVLLNSAKQELNGINITTEELAAFVVTINEPVINNELKNILISSGVINEDSNLNRKNYLNAIDKIRNAMINSKTIEVDPELVGYPEYDALIEELKKNAVAVHISNMVSVDSSEYSMYKMLDEAYETIGNAESLNAAMEAYEPIRQYVNSENGTNMPNNMEEEIFKDLYQDIYDEITISKFGIEVTKTNYYRTETEECNKIKTLNS